MSHYAYWSLHRMPFGRPELADDFFAGRPQREALARLDYLISGGRSSGLLIAPASTGRTMLLHRISVSAGFGDTAVDVVRTGARNRSTEELLVHLAQRLGVTHLGSGPSSSGRLGDVYRQVSERIAASARQSVRTVWLLDDATKLAAETAGALAAETPWFTAVVGCSPHDALPLAAAVGGCPLRIDLDPFDLGDTAGYVRHALAQAGAREDIFKDAAIVRLHELAEGRVGTIARLADLALLAGAAEQAGQISAELVEAVQDEVMPAAA